MNCLKKKSITSSANDNFYFASFDIESNVRKPIGIFLQNLTEICSMFQIEGNPVEFPKKADPIFNAFQSRLAVNLTGPPFNGTFRRSVLDATGSCEVSEVELVTAKSVGALSEVVVREYWN
jgi:hypothetical protein